MLLLQKLEISISRHACSAKIILDYVYAYFIIRGDDYWSPASHLYIHAMRPGLAMKFEAISLKYAL
jgi:hypothetical protein